MELLCHNPKVAVVSFLWLPHLHFSSNSLASQETDYFCHGQWSGSHWVPRAAASLLSPPVLLPILHESRAALGLHRHNPHLALLSALKSPLTSSPCLSHSSGTHLELLQYWRCQHWKLSRCPLCSSHRNSLKHNLWATSPALPALISLHSGNHPLQAQQPHHPFPGKAGACSPAHPHFPPFINPDLGQNIKTLQGFPDEEAASRQLIGNNCFSVQLNLPAGRAKDHEYISKSMNHFRWNSFWFHAF